MNEKLMNMAPLFENIEPQIRGFKKDTYGDMFAAYMERNSEFFGVLNRTLAAEGEEGFAGEFTDCLTSCAAGLIENAGNKVKRENMQLNLNMFMAIYLMPAILEGKQERAGQLTDAICEGWAVKFKGNNIKSAEFSSIQEGFKSKLCYVTTAVCKSLNKTEDCYELRLLKDYRDNYLMHTDNGVELIERYYDIAPTIVKRIDKSDKPEDRYRIIWEQYLKPCIEFIQNGEKEACGKTYIRMVEELQKEYIITAKEEEKKTAEYMKSGAVNPQEDEG